jgi:hypothetical protein
MVEQPGFKAIVRYGNFLADYGHQAAGSRVPERNTTHAYTMRTVLDEVT